MSEGVIADFTTEMYAMRQCAAASGRGELDKVHEDTLRYAPVSYTHLDVYKRQIWGNG